MTPPSDEAGTMTTSPGSQALHGIEAAAVVKQLGVEPERGLGAGPNRLTATKKESGFQAFMRQYQDFMQLVCWQPPLSTSW